MRILLSAAAAVCFVGLASANPPITIGNPQAEPAAAKPAVYEKISLDQLKALMVEAGYAVEPRKDASGDFLLATKDNDGLFMQTLDCAADGLCHVIYMESGSFNVKQKPPLEVLNALNGQTYWAWAVQSQKGATYMRFAAFTHGGVSAEFIKTLPGAFRNAVNLSLDDLVKQGFFNEPAAAAAPAADPAQQPGSTPKIGAQGLMTMERSGALPDLKSLLK